MFYRFPQKASSRFGFLLDIGRYFSALHSGVLALLPFSPTPWLRYIVSLALANPFQRGSYMSTKATDLRRATGSKVSIQTADGEKFQGTLVRLSRHGATIEFFNPAPAFQLSQVFTQVEIQDGDRTVFSGRATVAGLTETGLTLHCEVRFDAAHSGGGLIAPSQDNPESLQTAYERFYESWRVDCQIQPQFKTLIVEVEDFLDGVRQWLEQIEFGYRLKTNGRWADQEKTILAAVASKVIAAFNLRHQQFEDMAYALPPELMAAHEAFVQRHWHKHFLLSPFGQRTYFKPKGYAGDYEMMNMIHRNQPEGDTLYAKLIHSLLVSQWPAQSVRNRIAHLGRNLVQESLRLAPANRRARMLNIGCGPAREVQNFLRDSPLSNRADFTLIDFDNETLNHAQQRVEACKREFRRQAGLQTKKISVYDFLRKSKNAAPPQEETYDFIYCAGLYDYLTVATGQALIDLWYEWLTPGGLLLVANMNDTKPFRNFIEFTLDWRLIYRDTPELLSLVPDRLLPMTRVVAEETTVNMFLHIRKPDLDER